MDETDTKPTAKKASHKDAPAKDAAVEAGRTVVHPEPSSKDEGEGDKQGPSKAESMTGGQKPNPSSDGDDQTNAAGEDSSQKRDQGNTPSVSDSPKTSEKASKDVVDGSKTSKTESKPGSTGGSGQPSNRQKARGRRRRRERRRMNREARRSGGMMNPHDRGDSYRPGENYNSGYGGYGHGGYDYRGGGPDGPGRWERGGYDRHWSVPPGRNRDYRGPPPHGRYDHPYDRDDYRRSDYRGMSRTRSRSRSRSRSYSSSRSGSSRSLSRGHRSSRSRSASRSHEKRKPSRSAGSGGKRSSKTSGSGARDKDDRSPSGTRKRSGRSSEDRSSRPSRAKRGRSGSRSDNDERRRRRRRSYSSESSSGMSSSSSSSSSSEDEKGKKDTEVSAFSKDQRTVFVTQLVMRATEKDIRRYFRKKVGCKVNEVILLRDKRTNRHKGSAYVEVGRIEDVHKAVACSGQPPDFQRFPILVKASEAEKNYLIPASSSTVTSKMMGTTTSSTDDPMRSESGNIVEAQKVYVGGLDTSVTEQHLFALFGQLGDLEKVSMQLDPATGATKGYAFLSFRNPKHANLAIQVMSNQVLAGRPMKTGWANQPSSIAGVEVATSTDLPEDHAERTKRAYSVLAQLTGSVVASSESISATAEEAINLALGLPSESSAANSLSHVPTVAEARASLAAEANASVGAQVPVGESKEDKEAEKPTKNILVHNMYDKDEETEEGWALEVEEEFKEEASKFGKLKSVTVLSKQVGGKILASFETEEAAEACTKNLSGRWFDKRQLKVDFIQDGDVEALKE